MSNPPACRFDAMTVDRLEVLLSVEGRVLLDRLSREEPFARTLRVIESAPWKEKQLAARLRALDVGAVDIRRRGLAGDVAELHRRLKLRGTRRATLVMTRMLDQLWSLVCVDTDRPVPG